MGWKRSDQSKLLQSELRDYGTLLDNRVQKTNEKEEADDVHVLSLFKYATKLDLTLIAAGIICAILSGLLIPVLGLFFGGMTNTFISVSVNGLIPNEVADNVVSNLIANATPVEIDYNRSRITNPEIHRHALFFEVFYTIVEIFKTENPYDALQKNNTFTVTLTEADFRGSLNKYLIIYLIIGILILITSFLQTWCLEFASEHQAHNLRQTYFTQIMGQEVSWYDTNDNGNLSSKLTDDAEKIREGTGYKCVMIVQYFSTFICGILVGLSVSWQLTLIILCIAPFFIGLSAYSFKFISKSAVREQETYAEAGAVAEEVLSNIKTVNAFGGQTREIDRYHYWLEQGQKMATKKYNIFSVCLALTFFLMYGAYGVTFAYGSYLVRLGIASPGSIFTVFFSVLMGVLSIGQCLPFLNAVSSSIGTTASVNKIVNRKREIDPYSQTGRQASRLSGRIEFKDVYFSYPSRRNVQVLNGLSLTIEPGKQVAIVGPSGAGKSTIINLILRFYDTTNGDVCIDDVPIKKYNVHWLRSQIGLVSQEPVLFGVSIAENIRYGFVHATDEDIIEAAKQANAHDFISNLPNGYETLVGDMGSQLSNGQKQRIAIARVLIRNPQILLLDEATSVLDSECEEGIVQEILEKAMKGRTTIIVAHRLPTIRHADTICVMQAGKIVESGTHDELMSKTGAYTQLMQAHVKQETFSDDSASDSNSELSTLPETEVSKIPESHPSSSHSAESVKEVTIRDIGGKGMKDQSAKTDGISGPTFESTDTSSDDVEETATPWKVLDRQVSTNTIPDEDDEYETVITTIRETREILFEEEDEHAGKHDEVKKESSCLTGASSIGETEGERRLHRRRRSSKTEIFLGEERKDRYLLQPEKIEEEISFTKLLKMQSSECSWLLIGLIGAAGCGLISPILALYYGEIFRVFTLKGIAFQNACTFWSYMFAGFAVFCGLSYLFQTKGMTKANEKLITRSRALVFENILRQPVGWFDLETSSPEVLVNRLARNAPLIKAAAGLRLGQMLSATLSIICAFIIAFIFGWKLTLALFIAVPVIVFLYFKQTQILNENMSKETKQMDAAGRVASEAIRNIRTVQALGQEKLFAAIYSKNLQETYKKGKKNGFLYSIMHGINQGIVFLLYAVAFRLGGHLVELGEMTPDGIYKVFFALSLCATSVGTTFSFMQDYAKARYSIKLLNYLLTRRSEIDSSSPTGAKPEIEGKVEFKKVRFSYPTRPDVQVLKGLTFTVNVGKTLALVGETGCGKSTAISLLERFYDPASGAILVDDYDIRTLNISHLRSRIGIVTQEPILFDTTILENIAYGAIALQDEVPFEQVEKAARTANVHDFIMSLPERYDTIVGERGVQLSEGQKQRVAIARALVRDPKIILLDEATSALDATSEKVVQAALDKAKQGRTCIIVAHRLSTIQNADMICVMHKGKIVEKGTHHELQTLKGRYFELMQRQSDL